MFEYDEQLTHNAVNEIVAGLSPDVNLDGVDDLIEILGTEGELITDELEGKAAETYDSLVEEIYSRLEANELICENFHEEFPLECCILDDEIDEVITQFITEQEEYRTLCAC